MADVKNFAIGSDKELEADIEALASCEAYADSKIRVMPDGHRGKGAVIGSTITYSDKVVPYTVGVDIACRVSLFGIPYGSAYDFERIDAAVHNEVPAGKGVHKEAKDYFGFDYEDLACWHMFSSDEMERFRLSMGTLGGGNHYVSVEVDEERERAYVAVHCGTRSLGLKVAEHYQGIATAENKTRLEDFEENRRTYLKILRDIGNASAIQEYLSEADAKRERLEVPDELCYIDGVELDDYLHDMELLNLWSYMNHRTIFYSIADRVGWNRATNHITCAHNYIDTKERVIRKGAIPAHYGEMGVIPLNMRDGTLIVRGKGNEDWNSSLPHGAGRALSRAQAKNSLSVEDYRKTMSDNDVFTTCVCEGTLDEAPWAYKDSDATECAIAPNAEIVARLKPIYNFKATY